MEVAVSETTLLTGPALLALWGGGKRIKIESGVPKRHSFPAPIWLLDEGGRKGKRTKIEQDECETTLLTDPALIALGGRRVKKDGAICETALFPVPLRITQSCQHADGVLWLGRHERGRRMPGKMT